MSASSYRRVSQSEEAAATESDSNEFVTTATTSTSTRSRGERLEDKFVALGWVIVAVILAQWTDFFSIVWRDERLNRTLLKVAAGGFLVVVTLILYLGVYLPKIKGLPSDLSLWGVYCPKVLPILCATGFATYLVFVRALWPLWGFMAPLISGTEIMGMLMALHFVPTFGLC
jgi:uncharacterized BrkB/YihY/UPF0761 family membrane protein